MGETMAGTLSHQMRPYGWEGFQEYNLTYLTRARGLSFQGADVMYILNADHLMLIELVRCPTGNLEIGMADLSEEFYAEWPIRKKLDAENYTRRFWARANRYEITAKTFLDGRERAGYRLKDVHGERYRCPYGMISLEAIADSPCFISLPHFWGNEIWGGLEAREVYFNTNDDRRLHSFYIDVEPISGQTVREARRFQFNFRIERNMQFPQIVSSQERCEVPTADFSKNGYGSFILTVAKHCDSKQRSLKFRSDCSTRHSMVLQLPWLLLCLEQYHGLHKPKRGLISKAHLHRLTLYAM